MKNEIIFEFNRKGENDIAQLCTVIQVLGTPNQDNW